MKIFALLCSLCVSFNLNASTTGVPLLKAKVDVSDQVSLQRGARNFMNYCAGCHELKYLRYNKVARDIGVLNEKGELIEDLVKSSLMFNSEKITDTIRSSMKKDNAEAWFGITPPDLSLAARVRSPDWIYTYLKSFYKDESKAWGVNNLLFPDVAMPHVLINLQGIQVPQYKTHANNTKTIESLVLEKKGSMEPEDFDQFCSDVVTFLSYTAEPMQLERKRIGVWVLLFLSIFFVFAYLLKKEYWKDVY